MRLNIGLVNSTVAELRGVAMEMKAGLHRLESRLDVLESQPQEQLIKEVDSIHREVRVYMYMYMYQFLPSIL